MNFFEQELRKIISPKYPDAIYVGRACFVPLSEGTRARVEFTELGHADHYPALKMTVLNPKEGAVDRLLLRFSDLLGKKQVSNPNFSNGVVPHIWVDGLKPEWYVYQPTAQDYAAMRGAVTDYLGVFQTQEQGQAMTGPNHQQTLSM